MQSLHQLLIRFSALAPLMLLLAALVLRISDPLLLSDLRGRVFDNYQRLQPREFQSLPVFVIDIDDESLSRHGQWPWPRTLLAQLVDSLEATGVATIAFDFLFAEPDRTSPEILGMQWAGQPVYADLAPALEGYPSHDDLFAEAWERNSVIGGFAFSNSTESAPSPARSGFAVAGEGSGPFVPRFSGGVSNIPELDQAATGYGALNFIPDHDGILRRVPGFFELGEKQYPSLAIESLRVVQGAASVVIKAAGASGETSFGADTGVVALKVGHLEAPTDRSGAILLYDSGHRQERYIPAWHLLDPSQDPLDLEGAMVFVGTSAAGLRDFRTTPLEQVMPGVEVHVQVVEQMLLQQFLQRPDWADGAEIIYLLLLGLLVIAITSKFGAVWGLVTTIAATIAAVSLSWHAFSSSGWLVAPLYPGVVVILVFIAASSLSYWRKENEKRQVRRAFSQYVSPALVKRLEENQDELTLGGEMREMTILFCDIRGFTSISERFTATELTQVINQFLTPMTDLILARGGTIDKYMGDCIMAFWNAPLPDTDHALHGCRSALAMVDELKEINRRFREELFGADTPELKIGIGLNTGECCVGNMGSAQRFDYSVLGDSVNLASRLEGQSKTYGVDIVIGENTDQCLDGMATIELDLVKVKGKDEPVTLYALLGDREVYASEPFADLLNAHTTFLKVYREQRWDDAELCLATSRKYGAPWRLDVLYDLYQERIDDYRQNPPGADWDFVTVATSK